MDYQAGHDAVLEGLTAALAIAWKCVESYPWIPIVLALLLFAKMRKRR